MAFLKLTKSRGNGDVLVNTDYVKSVAPISRADRGARITFAANASGDEEKVNVNESFEFVAEQLGL